MKKKNKMKKRNNPLTDIPKGLGIVFIVMGLLLGSLFSFGMWWLNNSISKDEAISLSATFDYYYNVSHKGSLDYISINFTDNEELFIDGSCYTRNLENLLKELKSGEKVDLLIHPRSNGIWQMKSGDITILSFEDSAAFIKRDNIYFSAILGTLCYIMAIVGILSLIFHYIENKRFYYLKYKKY